MLQQLWNDRWILESSWAGRLVGAVEKLFSIPQDQGRLEQLGVQVVAQLNEIRASVVSLDEWFQRLREVAPDIAHGYHLADQLGDNRSHRLFDEMRADLGAVLHSRLQDAIAGEAGFAEHVLGRNWSATSPKELRYLLRARIAIPQFWHDGMLRVLSAGKGELPLDLVQYDVPRAIASAVACDLHFSLTSLEWSLPDKD